MEKRFFLFMFFILSIFACSTIFSMQTNESAEALLQENQKLTRIYELRERMHSDFYRPIKKIRIFIYFCCSESYLRSNFFARDMEKLVQSVKEFKDTDEKLTDFTHATDYVSAYPDGFYVHCTTSAVLENITEYWDNGIAFSERAIVALKNLCQTLQDFSEDRIDKRIKSIAVQFQQNLNNPEGRDFRLLEKSNKELRDRLHSE